MILLVHNSNQIFMILLVHIIYESIFHVSVYQISETKLYSWSTLTIYYASLHHYTWYCSYTSYTNERVSNIRDKVIFVIYAHNLLCLAYTIIHDIARTHHIRMGMVMVIFISIIWDIKTELTNNFNIFLMESGPHIIRIAETKIYSQFSTTYA